MVCIFRNETMSFLGTKVVFFHQRENVSIFAAFKNNLSIFKMINVEQATQIILNHTVSFENEVLPLEESVGKYLREPLEADRDFPPFDRVSMDGIAIQHQIFEKGQRLFQIEGIQAAGSEKKILNEEKNSIEVMTGAILPQNTDAVIRYEDTAINNGKAKILIEQVAHFQNIHAKGIDRKAGEVIVVAGKKISPAEIATAATIGKTHLKVARLPKAALISTGDELVDIATTPLAHQIRKSNIYALQASMKEWGMESQAFHLVDDKARIKTQLSNCLDTYKIIVLSGGVSKGKFDFIPEVLEEIGVKKLFHKVRQKPGKPFWFGKAANGHLIFALPGNPVSTFMCAYRYIYPWLKASLGLAAFDSLHAVLAKDFTFQPNLAYFLQVKINYLSNGSIEAIPIPGKGSGDLANLNDADGFLELPADKNVFKKGETYKLFLYRDLGSV